MVAKTMPSLFTPEARQRFSDRLLAMYRPYFGRIAAGEWHLRQMVTDNLDELRSVESLDRLAASVGRDLAGLQMLEVGCGTGITVAVARLFKSVEAFGIEPGTDEFDGAFAAAQDILREVGLDPAIVSKGVGEAIPYPNDRFDVVFSTNVLEHVADPPIVISEIIRVMKPGGMAQIIVPNYGSWWEGHYGILWVPHMPASIGKIYVRMLGRDPAFIDRLHLVTRGRLESWLEPHRARIRVLDWGVATWEGRVKGLGFSEYAALGRLKKILRVLHKVGIVPLVIAIGKRLHWETPLILTFRKLA